MEKMVALHVSIVGEHPGIRTKNRVSIPPYVPWTAAATKAEEEGGPFDGCSVLLSIVDLPFGAPIDYTHCVLEGVVK